MRVTQRILALAAVGLLGVGTQVQAQEVQFKGYTQGCFYGSDDTACDPGVLSSDGMYLYYLATPFNVTTESGYSSIDLGWLGLGLGRDNYTGDHFILELLFSAPNVDGGSAVFTAAVTGAIRWFSGGASLVFDPSTQIYDFTSGQSAGSFALTVNDASITPWSTTKVTGSIAMRSVTATPEPATTLLLATGLLGLIPLYRMRRKARS